MTPLLAGVAGMVFLVLAGLALVVLMPVLGAGEKRRRLAQLQQYRLGAHEAERADGMLNSPLARSAVAMTEQVVRSGHWEGHFAAQVDRAGIKLRPAEWVLVRLLVGVMVTALLVLAFGLIGLPFGALFGWLATAGYHRWRSRRRAERFAQALPPALQLVIGSLRSGFSLLQAFESMVREVGDPVATEFTRMLAEVRLGMELEEALERLARRTYNSDLAWAVMAIKVQRDVGGNLAEVLETTVSTIRERESLRGHVRSLSAEGRMSAWILVALPVLTMVFMLATRREYVGVLFTDPRGVFMLLVGLAMLALGSFWLARVVRVEV